MQQASYLEGGPLLWILPLYLHVNQNLMMMMMMMVSYECRNGVLDSQGLDIRSIFVTKLQAPVLHLHLFLELCPFENFIMEIVSSCKIFLRNLVQM